MPNKAGETNLGQLYHNIATKCTVEEMKSIFTKERGQRAQELVNTLDIKDDGLKSWFKKLIGGVFTSVGVIVDVRLKNMAKSYKAGKIFPGGEELDASKKKDEEFKKSAEKHKDELIKRVFGDVFKGNLFPGEGLSENLEKSKFNTLIDNAYNAICNGVKGTIDDKIETYVEAIKKGKKIK